MMKRVRRPLGLILMSVIVFSVIPISGAYASKRFRGKSVAVLYLGNDYYQDDDGNWVDANVFIIEALENSRHVSFNVTHIAPSGYDGYISMDLAFGDYDTVIFSEVWRTHFSEGQLKELEKYVKTGGGFVMFGGWGGFGGFESYGEWDETVVERMLPVSIKSNEDAIDMDYHLRPIIKPKHHPLLGDTSLKGAPALHGYNDVEAKKKGKVLAVNSENGAPILVVGKHKTGRVVAFASNPAGGWGMDFVDWARFDAFIQGMMAWSAGLN